MSEMNGYNVLLYICAGIFALFILISLIYGFCTYYNDFSAELRYLNCEINRTVGEERRFWRRRRKRLLLSLIPFVKYDGF